MIQTLNKVEYLFCKGILDALLNEKLITQKEYEEIDTLNKGK